MLSKFNAKNKIIREGCGLFENGGHLFYFRLAAVFQPHFHGTIEAVAPLCGGILKGALIHIHVGLPEHSIHGLQNRLGNGLGHFTVGVVQQNGLCYFSMVFYISKEPVVETPVTVDVLVDIGVLLHFRADVLTVKFGHFRGDVANIVKISVKCAAGNLRTINDGFHTDRLDILLLIGKGSKCVDDGFFGCFSLRRHCGIPLDISTLKIFYTSEQYLYLT